MRAGRSGDQDNPLVPAHCRMRVYDRDLIRGGHYGQRSCEPHLQAEHMAAPTNAANREESSCQLGAAHTWHETDMPKSLGDVRCWVNSGKHLLALSFTGFDLGCVKTCAHEKRAEWFSLLSYPDNRRQRFCFSN